MVARGIWVGVVLALPLISLVDTFVINYFDSFGGAACDVYCGPGNLLTLYALMALGLVLWFAGMCVFLVEVIRTKARGWWAWGALALEIASPLALSLQLFAIGH